MKTLKISELSNKLQEHLDMVAESDEVYKISTGKGEGEGVVMMSLREFNSWKETQHLLESAASKEGLMESLARIEEGDIIPYEPGQLWESLTEEQKEEVMLSYEESEREENLVPRDKVFGKRE